MELTKRLAQTADLCYNIERAGEQGLQNLDNRIGGPRWVI
jgi:hypothetical protein